MEFGVTVICGGIGRLLDYRLDPMDFDKGFRLGLYSMHLLLHSSTPSEVLLYL